MKLRNKKTGDIRNAVDIDMYTDSVYLKVSDGESDNETIEYHSLAELNEEWEDALEEPKKYWSIDCGMANEYTWNDDEWDRAIEAVGLKFGTKEECERAIEKMKAWKRMKDKGFRFTGVSGLGSEIHFRADEKYNNAHIMFDEYGSSSDDLKQYNKDLDLLFGGEE